VLRTLADREPGGQSRRVTASEVRHRRGQIVGCESVPCDAVASVKSGLDVPSHPGEDSGPNRWLDREGA